MLSKIKYVDGCAVLVLSNRQVFFHNVTDLSHIMIKPTVCICKNKDADQLRSYCEADQLLCFHYTISTTPLLCKSKNFVLQAFFCVCRAQFVSDLFRNHIVGFLMVSAQL